MENNNCVSVAPMTYQEKVDMYMRCTKLQLAQMLAERDQINSVPNYPWNPIITCDSNIKLLVPEQALVDMKKYDTESA